MSHHSYIQRCIDLAKNARGNTSPNPLVGSVIVHQNKIIGEGWHHAAGQPHAEVNAINSVAHPALLTKSTLYVNLEPCAHFGKTPPCADLIIEKKIPKVVIGCRDPFTEVNGRGIEKLKAAGVEVTEGVLEQECRNLNAPFFTFHTKKRPYIILKWAQTANGFMDAGRKPGEGGIRWITQPETKVLVHKWRAEVDAILVGYNTVVNDNPELTVREVNGKNPIRLVMDPHGDLKNGFKVFDEQAETYILTDKNLQTDKGGMYQKRGRPQTSMKDLLDFLYQKNIQSLLVEGGSKTLKAFLKAKMWDEARVLTGIAHFEDGLPAPVLKKGLVETVPFGKDILNIYRP